MDRRLFQTCGRAALALLLAPCLLGSFAPRAGAEPVRLEDHRLDQLTARTAKVSTQLVVDGAALEIVDTRSVQLQGNAQREVAAVGVSNAGAADVVTVSNVAETGAGALEQQNRALQEAIRQGELARYARVVGAREIRADRVHSETRETSRQQVDLVRNLELSMTQTVTTYDVTLTPERLTLFDDPVPLFASRSFQLFDLEIQIPRVDLTIAGGNFQLAPILPRSISIASATFNTGGVLLHGTDIIFETPSITLPSIGFEICIFRRGCAPDTGFPLVEVVIGGGDVPIPLNGGEEIRIEDANILGQLGISFGYAIAGSGDVTIDAGGVEVRGTLPVGLGLLGDIGSNVDSPLINAAAVVIEFLDPPTIELPLDHTFDFPLPEGLELHFDDMACVHQTGQSAPVCTPLDSTTTSVEVSDHTETHTEHESEIFGRFDMASSSDSQRGEVDVQGADAEAIVLGESSLEARRYHIVRLGGGAQAQARALHAVNAANAIVGNGLNVSSLDAAGLPRPRAALDARQSNSFRQVGGL